MADSNNPNNPPPGFFQKFQDWLEERGSAGGGPGNSGPSISDRITEGLGRQLESLRHSIDRLAKAEEETIRQMAAERASRPRGSGPPPPSFLDRMREFGASVGRRFEGVGHLFNEFDQKGFSGIGRSISSSVASSREAIVSVLSEAFSKAMERTAKAGSAMASPFRGVGTLWNVFEQHGFSGLGRAAGGAFKDWSQLVSTRMAYMRSGSGAAFGGIGAVIASILGGIGSAATAAAKTAITAISSIFTGATKVISAGVSTIGSAFAAVAGVVGSATSVVLSFGSIFNTGIGFVGKAIAELMKEFGHFFSFVTKTISSAFGLLGDIVSGSLSLVSKAFTAFGNTVAGIAGFAAKSLGVVFSVPFNIFKYAVEGIQQFLGLAVQFRRSAEETAVVARRFAPFSPAALLAGNMLELGNVYRQMVASQRTGGTAANLINQVNRTRNAWLPLDVALQNFDNQFATFRSRLAEHIANGISPLVDEVSRWISSKVGSPTSLADWVAEKVSDIFTSIRDKIFGSDVSVTDVLDKVAEVATNTFNYITESAATVYNSVTQFVGKAASSLVSFVEKLPENIKFLYEEMSKLFSDLSTRFQEFKTEVFSAGAELATAAGEMAAAVAELAASLMESAKKVSGILGWNPMKDANEAGKGVNRRIEGFFGNPHPENAAPARWAHNAGVRTREWLLRQFGWGGHPAEAAPLAADAGAGAGAGAANAGERARQAFDRIARALRPAGNPAHAQANALGVSVAKWIAGLRATLFGGGAKPGSLDGLLDGLKSIAAQANKKIDAVNRAWNLVSPQQVAAGRRIGLGAVAGAIGGGNPAAQMAAMLAQFDAADNKKKNKATVNEDSPFELGPADMFFMQQVARARGGGPVINPWIRRPPDGFGSAPIQGGGGAPVPIPGNKRKGMDPRLLRPPPIPRGPAPVVPRPAPPPEKGGHRDADPMNENFMGPRPKDWHDPFAARS